MKRLRDSNPKHLGYQHISKLFGSFIHIGPNGRHICLVLEPMAESLASFGALFPKSQIPSNIVRRFTRQLLLALDYAHESGIIHTGKHLISSSMKELIFGKISNLEIL